MKYLFNAVCLLLLSTLVLTSCKKEEDEGLLPKISFKTTSGYTGTSATVTSGTVLKYGITASKSEDKDVLTKFTVTASYDGGAETTLYSENLSGANGDNYDHDIEVTAASGHTTEKYTFTVVNRDGLTNSVSSTITVQ